MLVSKSQRILIGLIGVGGLLTLALSCWQLRDFGPSQESIADRNKQKFTEKLKPMNYQVRAEGANENERANENARLRSDYPLHFDGENVDTAQPQVDSFSRQKNFAVPSAVSPASELPKPSSNQHAAYEEAVSDSAFVPPSRSKRYNLDLSPKNGNRIDTPDPPSQVSFGLVEQAGERNVELPAEAEFTPNHVVPDRFANASKIDSREPRSELRFNPKPPSRTKVASNKKVEPATNAVEPAKVKAAGKNSISTTEFRLAAQPKFGAHYKDETPTIDGRAWETTPSELDFSPDPVDATAPYDPYPQMDVYEGKSLYANQRPLLEIGKPWYQLGQLPENQFWLGFHNPVSPQLLLFGDSRWVAASNRANGDSETQIAAEINLFFNLQLTGTERFHMFMAPLDNGVKNYRYLLDEDRFDEELDFDIDFGYFEGDLGAIVGGMVGETMPFDLPFAIGVMPLLVQNGIWMEDAFLGVAATIPARNSPAFDISNMDITFFAGFDEIISPAFEFEDDAAKMVGVMGFFEANNGYWEIDYAFLEDRTSRDRSYHNIGLAFTRRYGRFVSNSTRVIINAGQSNLGGPNTADGVLLLSENSLITAAPSTVVPYFNLFAGFDRPQSAARNAAAGGILRNTGILFESDGVTNFPTLDATANNTYGLAAGLNLLPNDFSQQLVVEAAMLGVMGDRATRNAAGDQYGVGVRYQLPLNNAMIFRMDAMAGFLRNEDDVNGVRMELRHKF